MTMDDQRRDALAANLAAVRERIAAACRGAGRDPGEVALIVVTKTYPAEDVLRLVSLGVVDIGENRDQEAAPKAAEVAEALGATGQASLRWHFVGQLQRNKCKSVVRYAGLVHSVDSVRLVQALDRAAIDRAGIDRDADRAGLDHDAPGIDVLVQVSIDGDPTRGGAVPTGDAGEDVALDRVLAAVASSAGLRLRGLMAVAPLGWEPARAFASLAEVHARVRAEYPSATLLSAGMSADLEEAIRHGATHVRVGSAVLGHRR